MCIVIYLIGLVRISGSLKKDGFVVMPQRNGVVLNN